MLEHRRRLRMEYLEHRMMLHGNPTFSGPLPDVTGDGIVGIPDILLVVQQWGRDTPLGDATGDSHVDGLDLAAVLGSYGASPHADSPALLQEHLDVLRLFPPVQADAIAVRSGDWSDPATWSNASVPRAGQKVWIPAWYSIDISQELTEPLKWVRVDGTLSFDNSVNTALTVETLMGSTTGQLHIKTVDPNIVTRITIADSGPIDTKWDPKEFSRGIIWHGSTEMQGASKTTWTTLQPVTAGSAQINVADSSGWQVGDRLVLGGSGVEYSHYSWQIVPHDDDVRIAAIDGNRIILDHALLFDHAAVESQNPVVINLTRNVIVESQNPALDRRGHVMLMHNPNQEVSYVAFDNLGRTDKSRPVTDPDGLGNGLENVRGRYALHIHRTGIDASPVEVTGIAIIGSPGWGLVNHDSNVMADHNVSFNVYGAHFVTELGDERGSFTNNVAVRSGGFGRVDDLRGNNDAGHSGDGFWLEGGNVSVAGNIAIGMTSGFTFFTPARDQPITFQNNVALQSTQSLTIWDTGGNGVNSRPAPTNEFIGNFLQGTVLMGYSSRLAFRENLVTVFNNEISPIGFSHTGVNTDIRYVDNTVTGFKTGILMPTEGDNLLEGGYYDNLQTNLLIQNTQQNRYRHIDIIGATFGERATWNVEMSISFFSYDLRPAYPVGPYAQYQSVPDWHRLFATDNTVVGAASEVRLDGVLLVFEEQGADFQFGKRLTRFPDEIRYEPDGITLATGASLNARGLYVGGLPLPRGKQYHMDKVRGVLLPRG